MLPRKTIPATVRFTVWNTHIGKEVADANCWLNCGNKISQQLFECGHIISVKDGGSDDIGNLRPICGLCNKSIGSSNMEEFKKYYGYAENKQDVQQKTIINNITSLPDNIFEDTRNQDMQQETTTNNITSLPDNIFEDINKQDVPQVTINNNTSTEANNVISLLDKQQKPIINNTSAEVNNIALSPDNIFEDINNINYIENIKEFALKNNITMSIDANKNCIGFTKSNLKNIRQYYCNKYCGKFPNKPTINNALKLLNYIYEYLINHFTRIRYCDCDVVTIKLNEELVLQLLQIFSANNITYDYDKQSKCVAFEDIYGVTCCSLYIITKSDVNLQNITDNLSSLKLDFYNYDLNNIINLDLLQLVTGYYNLIPTCEITLAILYNQNKKQDSSLTHIINNLRANEYFMSTSKCGMVQSVLYDIIAKSKTLSELENKYNNIIIPTFAGTSKTAFASSIILTDEIVNDLLARCGDSSYYYLPSQYHKRINLIELMDGFCSTSILSYTLPTSFSKLYSAFRKVFVNDRRFNRWLNKAVSEKLITNIHSDDLIKISVIEEKCYSIDHIFYPLITNSQLVEELNKVDKTKESKLLTIPHYVFRDINNPDYIENINSVAKFYNIPLRIYMTEFNSHSKYISYPRLSSQNLSYIREYFCGKYLQSDNDAAISMLTFAYEYIINYITDISNKELLSIKLNMELIPYFLKMLDQDKICYVFNKSAMKITFINLCATQKTIKIITRAIRGSKMDTHTYYEYSDYKYLNLYNYELDDAINLEMCKIIQDYYIFLGIRNLTLPIVWYIYKLETCNDAKAYSQIFTFLLSDPIYNSTNVVTIFRVSTSFEDFENKYNEYLSKLINNYGRQVLLRVIQTNKIINITHNLLSDYMHPRYNSSLITLSQHMRDLDKKFRISKSSPDIIFNCITNLSFNLFYTEHKQQIKKDCRFGRWFNKAVASNSLPISDIHIDDIELLNDSNYITFFPQLYKLNILHVTTRSIFKEALNNSITENKLLINDIQSHHLPLLDNNIKVCLSAYTEDEQSYISNYSNFQQLVTNNCTLKTIYDFSLTYPKYISIIPNKIIVTSLQKNHYDYSDFISDLAGTELAGTIHENYIDLIEKVTNDKPKLVHQLDKNIILKFSYFSNKLVKKIIKHSICEDSLLSIGIKNSAVIKYCNTYSKSLAYSDICSILEHDAKYFYYILNKTPEICLLALKKDGMALRYIIKQTEEYCILAILQNKSAYNYIDKKFLSDEFKIRLLQTNGLILKYIKNQTPEMCDIAIKNNLQASKYAKFKSIDLFF
jgi:hypothetical protein